MTIRNATGEMYSGDSKQVTIPITVRSTGTTATLTGASARWGLFTKAGDALVDALVLKSTALTGDNLISIVSSVGTNDALRFNLVPADTAALGSVPGQSYYMEAEVIDSAGKVYTVMTGSLRIYTDTLT